jgi:hypothetical protein
MVVGLIPKATGPMSAEMREALDQREKLMEQRTAAIVRDAVTRNELWLSDLGPVPPDAAGRSRWLCAAGIAAAYRDRHGVEGPGAIGHPAEARTTANPSRRADAARVRVAIAAIHPTPPPLVPAAAFGQVEAAASGPAISV